MCETDFPLQYPDTIKSEFIRTSDLVFEDGNRITAKLIWEYMIHEGPARYPYAFSTKPTYNGQLSGDVTFLSGIKQNYLNLTRFDRLQEMHMNGKPIVVIQGGITYEPYYAAGCIPVGPMFPRSWMLNLLEGQGLKQANLKGMALLEEARINLTVESCNLIAYLALLKNNELPIDAIAPCLCTRCSDMVYATEACKAGDIMIPATFMDYPVNHDWGAWRVSYLKKEILSLTEKLGNLSGKTVTNEELTAEIKLENYARRLVRESQKMWWDAKTPPTNSIDNTLPQFGIMGAFDFTAAVTVLEETQAEIRKRIQNGILGQGLVDDPVRLFICGSCASPNPAFIDKKGGVLVGKEDQWSTISMDVKESGDPFKNLAEAYAALPYERPTVERAEWVVQQVRDSRADGVIFMYNWGCNYQSAVAGMVTDIIKNRTGLPTMCIEVGELTRMESIEQSQNRTESFIEMLK